MLKNEIKKLDDWIKSTCNNISINNMVFKLSTNNLYITVYILNPYNYIFGFMVIIRYYKIIYIMY